jgi:hypothetical protein
MPDDVLEQAITGEPVMVTLKGKSYPIAFNMAIVALYQSETARIERGRPQREDPDPKCLCGQNKSAHEGPELIRIDEAKHVLCWHFRLDDPLRGDSLFLRQDWQKIDLELDPERWIACLWAALHQLQPDGETWKAPMTKAQLAGMIPPNNEARLISNKVAEAFAQCFPRAKPAKEAAPNAAAPGEPALETGSTSASSSKSSTDAPANVSASAAQNS